MFIYHPLLPHPQKKNFLSRKTEYLGCQNQEKTEIDCKIKQNKPSIYKSKNHVFKQFSVPKIKKENVRKHSKSWKEKPWLPIKGSLRF